MEKRLNTFEAAHHLRTIGTSYSPGTLRVWRSQGRGPRFHRVNRRVFYRIQDLENFAKGEVVETADSLKFETQSL